MLAFSFLPTRSMSGIREGIDRCYSSRTHRTEPGVHRFKDFLFNHSFTNTRALAIPNFASADKFRQTAAEGT